MARPGLSLTRRAPTALAAAVVAGAALTSCVAGGGGPTQSQYIAVADSICETHKEEIAEIERTNVEEPNQNRPDRWIRAELVPQYRAMLGQLRGIRPPDGDAQYLTGLYADLEHEVSLLQVRPSDGPARIRSNEDLRRRFASYGMKVCGRV